jgi:hypothetical protein
MFSAAVGMSVYQNNLYIVVDIRKSTLYV